MTNRQPTPEALKAAYAFYIVNKGEMPIALGLALDDFAQQAVEYERQIRYLNSHDFLERKGIKRKIARQARDWALDEAERAARGADTYVPAQSEIALAYEHGRKNAAADIRALKSKEKANEPTAHC